MVQAQAQSAMAVENIIRPLDIEQEEEETMDKCNREWAHLMLYSSTHPPLSSVVLF
jgi:hypothetical protein